MQPDETNLYFYKATCLRVVDGDTIDLDIDVGFHTHVHERVRLAGIDTPETYGVKKTSAEYAEGMKAKARVEELLLPGKKFEFFIETVKDKTGKYGRYLAEVWIDTAWRQGPVAEGAVWRKLGDILVEEGLAERKDY